MKPFFYYDQLTWLEIDSLPRETPLVLPLGDVNEIEDLRITLGNPVNIGILPPFPFGWKGSLLEVSDNALETYLMNLVQGLIEDGFKNVYVLSPPGVDINLGDHQIILPKDSYAQSPIMFQNNGDDSKVVLIPIGHTEQHSHHLPMATDTIIIEAISKGIVKEVPEKCFSLPVMPYGVSTHRSSFCGTLNAGGRAFEDFWLDIIKALVDLGHDRFYFLNGHGGNHSFLVNIVKYGGEKFRRIFCATSWLYLSGPEGINSLERYRSSPIGGMGHAGELETSLILYLRNDLVHMDRVIDDTNYISTPSFFMDWIEGGALIANPPWDDESLHGGYGKGSEGLPEKGKLWLEAAIKEKIAHIFEIIEQQNRRESRRKNGYGLWGINKNS